MRIVILLFIYFISLFAYSQQSAQDLLNIFDSEDKKNVLTFATFKSKKIINLQSVEQSAKNELDFVISHRFGPLNSGYTDLFGLDIGSVRMFLDYGITDNLSILLARSSSEKIIDLSFKSRIITQGFRSSPITISSYTTISFDTLEPLWAPFDLDTDTLTKIFSFQHQFMFACKINSKLSTQLSPIYCHYYQSDKTTFTGKNIHSMALGIAGRYKINKSTSINSEWVPILIRELQFINPSNKEDDIINSFSIGVDIETGGHVFQLFATNSERMSEKGFIFQNNNFWSDAGVFIGFNIARTFNL